MSCLISLKNINFKYNLDPILENVDFSLNRGDRVAIVGHNGSGKSTLLNILSGKFKEFKGERAVSKGLRIEIVEQFLDEQLKEHTLLNCLLQKIPEENRRENTYLAEILLNDLFFRPGEFDTKVGNLSGGGQNRLMFARAIINNPDVVIMDEPTNHLDLKSLLYIEDFLITKAKFSFGVVSHDKRFLNNVGNKTIVLRDHTSYSFALPYDQALKELAAADENAKKRRELEEKEIDRIRKSAKRIADWGRTFDNEDLSKKAKSMEKRADKLEDEKTFVGQGNPYQLNLNFEKIHSKIALQIHESEVHYGDELAFDKGNKLYDINKFFINSGEKVALLGANGTGKSTLINTIVKKIHDQEHSPHFRAAPNIKCGHYDQEQLVLNPENSIAKEVMKLAQCDDETAKNALIRAGFVYNRHQVLVNTLSGGEKSRIIFCALYLTCPNFLILDEPTNHIDLDGKDELVAALKQTNISALITGHDRNFIEEVVDRYVMIKDGELVEIDSPEEFYRDLMKTAHDEREIEEEIEEDPHHDILNELLLLEEKLSADLERKPKFQKPKKQSEWRARMDFLNKKLEEV